MQNIDLKEFENASALDIALAQSVAEQLRATVAAEGEAWLVVSGGRTPLGFFCELSQVELPWEQVVVTLADERWVDADHQDSNEKLVRENLLINEAAKARFVSLKAAPVDALEGESEIEQRLADAPRFAVVILGMGDDGHTASLFPEAEALQAGLDMNSGRACLAVQPLHAPHQRISMTLPRLLNCEQLIVHISGENKYRVLEAAMAGSDVTELPIRAVLQQQNPAPTVYWAR